MEYRLPYIQHAQNIKRPKTDQYIDNPMRVLGIKSFLVVLAPHLIGNTQNGLRMDIVQLKHLITTVLHRKCFQLLHYLLWCQELTNERILRVLL